MSNDFSHLHSQLLGFQTDSLSPTPLSMNSLHSHLHFPAMQRCLLLQTLESNLHLKSLESLRKQEIHDIKRQLNMLEDEIYDILER